MDSTEFETHIALARRNSALSQRDLWVCLMEAMQSSETEVTRGLHQHFGIAAVAQDTWPQYCSQAKVSAIGPGFLMVSNEQALLMFADPWSNDAVQTFKHHNDGSTLLAIALPGQLVALQAFVNPVTQNMQLPHADASKNAKLGNGVQSSSVVAFVDDAIVQAQTDGASDIHFEVNRKGVGIKFRIDGVMCIGPRFDDAQRAEEVVSRIKVLAQLDITERRRPQDGRIHWTPANGDAIDLRVSIMPSIFGEDAVLRLLDKAQLLHESTAISLDSLGFDSERSMVLRELARRPHGMLLITGPTGSGKTTTVYAALSEVNDGLEKIVTIEDPVEYELPGVLQIPVNEQKGLTFATGLRSILRHDPDKILVGEIRDAETAEIAIQSSLTGHLVFTTVHANSLFDVLGRFQHFGIDPFGLASALNGIVVQRLLRKLCPHCLQWRDPTLDDLRMLSNSDAALFKKIPCAVGCSLCRNTGYRGRFVVAEIFELTDAVRDLIVNKRSLSDLKEIVYKDKSQGLLAQSLQSVANGRTTLAEVKRVVGFV